MPRKFQRRFNFTNRVRIPQNALAFAVDATEGKVVARLLRLELPADHPHDPALWAAADVVIEAWRMSTASYLRREIGSVKDIQNKTGILFEETLHDFEDANGISFRLKVIDRLDRRLLAEADKITSEGDTLPADRAELIVVRPEDLGELPWMVDWSEEDGSGPVVLVNNQLADNANYMTRDPALAGAIVPQVFREVLFRLCIRDDLQQTTWGKKWLEHIGRFHAEPLPENSSEQWGLADIWVREAAVAFGAKYALTQKSNERFAIDAEVER